QEGQGPLRTGRLTSAETKARNKRLDGLAKDWADLEPNAWPTSTSAGGRAAGDEGREEAPASSDHPALRPSKFSLLNEGRLLDESGNPIVSPILARDACKCSECVDPSD